LCTCAVGESSDFCRHCVVVALEVSDHEPEQRQPPKPNAPIAQTCASTSRAAPSHPQVAA
jgi:uncharacterized Zn finger protein